MNRIFNIGNFLKSNGLPESRSFSSDIALRQFYQSEDRERYLLLKKTEEDRFKQQELIRERLWR